MPNGEMLTEWFPRGPYNFDAVAPNLPTQPIRTLLTAAESALVEAINIIANLQAQVTVQTASGVWLRNHAPLYGVAPLPDESDEELRERILAALGTPRITCPALQDYLQDWFNARYPDPPTVVVCDRQTNPTLAAQYGLVPAQFLVLLNWQLGIDDAWFLDYEYLDYTTFLSLALIYTPPDELLGPFMTRWKGAGFMPVWRNHVQYGYPAGIVTIADEAVLTVADTYGG